MIRRRTTLSKKGEPRKYLTFTALESGTFKFTRSRGCSGNFYYSIDDGATWISLPSGTNTPTISANNTISFKGNLVPDDEYYTYVGNFSSTGNFAASGCAMSVIY